MFEQFKQQKSFLTRVKSVSSIKYLIEFDENGAFLVVCDGKLKPLKEIDFRVYSGIDREILKVIEEFNQESFFNVSWEEEEDKLYLGKVPKLIELLRLSKKVYDKNNTLIEFQEGIKEVVLQITHDEDKIKTTVLVDKKSDFKFISNQYVLHEDKIYQIKDIGENFQALNSFNFTIKKDRLEEILTLLFSNFTNILVDYEDFKTIFKDESKVITPAIIFEKVTNDNELLLKTGATIGNLSAEFFNDFNVTKVALLNELEKKIDIYECDFEEVFEVYNFVYKTLNSIKRKIKNGSFSEDEGEFVIDESIAKEFIANYLHTLLTKAVIFGSNKLKSYGYSAIKPTLNVAFKDKIDFLESSDVEISIDKQKFDILEFIKLYNKHSYIPLNSGDKAIVDKKYIQKLERIFKKEGKNIKISFFDLPEIEELISKKEQKVFKKSREFYEGFNKLKSKRTTIPKLQDVKYREYQKEGFKWLKYLYDNSFGGCLADDMGLGKTLQTITLFSHIYPKVKKPSLVIMPKSLLNNWQNELKKFAPNLTFYTYYGTDRDIKKVKEYQIILTSYGMVRSDIQKLKEIEFDTIVLDESQAIKNINSKISKAVMLLKGEHRFALSGTPLENSLFELYALFRFLNPGMFKSLNDFKRYYVLPIQSNANEEVAKVLKAKVSPFILRRLKTDVLKDLPPKQEQVIYIEMNDEQKEFYETKRRYFKTLLDTQIATNGIVNSRFLILQAFNELRQIASIPEAKSDDTIKSSKIDDMFGMLEDIIMNNHKVLIFVNFLHSLELISQKADEMGYKHITMSGSTKNRQELVDRFQNDKDIKLFIMTLKVGGVGLNLTSADYVFIFDPWWNKAAQNQAIDRAHRIGQKNKVFSYELITKGTIEEKILELQQQKQDLTDIIIGGDETGLKALSKEDIDFILG